MRNNLIVFICITLYLISSITCVFINKYVLMENTIDKRDEKNIKESIFSLYNEIKELWPLIITFNFTLQIKFNLLMIISCIIVSIGFLIFSLDAVNTNYIYVLYGTIVSIIQAIHLNLIKKKLIIYKDKMEDFWNV
ncbi:hypothetical protein PFNF54_00942 [Plasmodium falciparum NF54]|uniref:Uncharacterized protein n=1 Tax=Plasmodium falciparum (isolate NF54) TaxID=5843 RepID=W7JZW0_PLAFO|nr:hypothetical protein PFNF54_00942 [Plasmodium falciparum NF54]